MDLSGVLAALRRHPQFAALRRQLENPLRPPAVALRQGGRAAFLAALWQIQAAPLLVLAPHPEDARRLCDQLLTYLGETAPVFLFPEPEVLPYERLAVDARTANLRLTALAALAPHALRSAEERLSSNGRGQGEGESPAWANGRGDSPPPLVVASIAAALWPTLPPAAFAGGEAQIALKVGQRIRLASLFAAWVNLGYRHEPVVEAPGAFSQRGGIIDIYPPQSDLPYRLELFDDEIETIRLFDPASQRSVRPVEGLSIIPAQEQLPRLVDEAAARARAAQMDLSRCGPDTRERIEEDLQGLFGAPDRETLTFYNGLFNQASLLDYLPAGGLAVVDRQSQLEAAAQELAERFERMRASREERGELPRNFPAPYLPLAAVLGRLKEQRRLDLGSWLAEGGADPIFRPAPAYYGKLEDWVEAVKRQRGAGQAVAAVSQHASRLAEILSEAGVPASVSETLSDPPQAGGVYLLAGALREGWAVSLPAPAVGTEAPPRNGRELELTLLTDAELFGSVKERRYRHTRPQRNAPAVSLAELVPGNYLVHVDHGVARFAGMTRIAQNGEEKEYLVLEYADADKLYVPTEHLDRVGAYVAAQDITPALTRLGTADWARVKERVKGATRELAQELLKLYAARQVAEGFEFGADTVWQQELEDAFPYEETPDQVRIIAEVKQDMELPKPMDRLLCGDVGYGKTEIALRAAFKAATEGKQVAVLVPTTVLAQQHYATFSERLSPYPIKVEVLSRFRSPKEQQQVVEGLKDGSVDVVVGTHRLLQKDVSFKDLGLVIVDEEHRFGVSHKERMKQLCRHVDVLTLSATPIPRTLYMALAGLRDMSNLDTPPESRLPVKTFVAEYSDEIIKEAILRELERDGQVFFLHNRVRSIQQKTAELAELVPQARFLVGHGQMGETELEDVMVAFANREADVLVCTTIIESGLDFPNVNTIIIERADRFGLSQLYQLRGRVGRGDHRAYAYLLLPGGRQITETAQKRIEAILEASELGSGYRIAMRDLEIRGAGNLLGAAQSGQIHAVGLELYSQLLQDAVQEVAEETGRANLPPQARAGFELPQIELPVTASIPEDYIDHLPTRLDVYQRLARLRDRKQLPELREELKDRFGPIPDTVESLLQVAELRAAAGRVGVESVSQAGDSIILTLRSPVGGARVPLQRALGPAATVGNQQITVSKRRLGDQWQTRLVRLLDRLQVFQEKLAQPVG